LGSILHQTLPPDALLIVDDSSNDATEMMLEKYRPLFQADIMYLHPNPPGTGLPAARNVGIAHVPEDADIIVFLDDDVTLDSRYLESVGEQFLVSPEVSGVGGYIAEGYHRRPLYEKLLLAAIGFFVPTLVPVSPIHFRITKTGEALTPLFIQYTDTFGTAQWLSGCNMAYRTSVFREGNLFDENFVRYAQGEDILFSHRLYKNGKNLLITKKARLHHRVSTEERMPPVKQLFMVLGYRKYAIQKFSGNGTAGSLYYQWFLVNFFMSAFILSLIRKKDLSYMKNSLKAYHLFKQFGPQIGTNDLASFNAVFSNPGTD
jgi:GT2 family glycosyltransferase